MWEVSLRDETTEPPGPQRSLPLAKVITLWVPRRFLTSSGVDVECFLADVNEKVVRRGLILWDGQVLTAPITDTIKKGILKPKPRIVHESPILNPILKVVASTDSIIVGKHTELFCEQVVADPTLDVPPRRDWQAPQREFFGLKDPYQMAEDAGEYTQHHVMTRVLDPYLSPTERIAAIVNGEKDSYYFYCPCHQADVVYTTRHRLVCMGCGAMHVVLRQPLPVHPKWLLTPEEWVEFFDDEGSRRDEEIEMSVVDFQDVENAETIWTTNQWDEAKHRFVFFARSSPVEIAEAIRGTEADPSVFLQAGWTPVDTSPPPAHQVANNSVDVDLIENAAYSLREGVTSFLAARKNSERLVNAIPQLFRAVELLLKAKLRDLEAHGLDDHPNNPTVLQRVTARGVSLTKEEVDTVSRLRQLRNVLQHGTAKFNYRTGLAVLRKTIVFLDRFVHAELGLWMGDAIPPDDWYQLLAITKIATTAKEVAGVRLEEIRQDPEATISLCARCGRNALVRPHPRTGASCIFCGHVPVYDEEQQRDLSG